jgi:lipoate-protein ligase A
MDSYSKICGAIIQGLRYVGINGEYIPINDIIVEGKKISGNAQTRKFKTVLQHGTILLDVDVDKMFLLLKVPNEKIKDKLIEDIKERVTSIRHVKGDKVDFNQLVESMKKGFEDEFDINLVEGSLTGDEKELTKKFENECFSNMEWNYRR